MLPATIAGDEKTLDTRAQWVRTLLLHWLLKQLRRTKLIITANQKERERERERIEEKRRKKKRDIVRKIAFSLLAGGGGIGVGGCFTLGRHATTKALPKSVILTVQ